MAALRYEKVAEILERAHRIDRKCELFGASAHQYKLNPPIDEAIVRSAEEKYNFTLPKDYFQFITQIADGGAGPDYGIMSFEDSFMRRDHNRFHEAYQCSLGTPFAPRPMMPEDAESCSFNKDAYEENPYKFFIYRKEKDSLCDTDGFLVLGTHGCQWDFGLVVSGEHKGQVFTTDHENAYHLLAYSFYEFYKRWLDWLSDAENIQRQLNMWHGKRT